MVLPSNRNSSRSSTRARIVWKRKNKDNVSWNCYGGGKITQREAFGGWIRPCASGEERIALSTIRERSTITRACFCWLWDSNANEMRAYPQQLEGNSRRSGCFTSRCSHCAYLYILLSYHLPCAMTIALHSVDSSLRLGENDVVRDMSRIFHRVAMV